MNLSIRPLSRVFSGDKIIDSKLLNKLGVQVFRTIAARLVYTLRPMSVDPAMADKLTELGRDGVVLLPNFLPPDHFEGVRRECALLDRCVDKMKVGPHGPNTMGVTPIWGFAEALLPHIHNFYSDPRLSALMGAAERRPLGALVRYGEMECLTYGSSGDLEDPQTQLHSDVFFNTHKAWLYLDDVLTENGPLAYVKGSHRLNLTRLSFAYSDSWMRDKRSDPSRRISQRERDRLGVDETIMTCAKNTLVIVNTCGYHRRLQGQSGQRRHALHLSLRANPFAPHRLLERLSRHPHVFRVLRRERERWLGTAQN